ncbi:Cytochrome P450 [Melia azedarach]|uniref:Cytochrome P450 n=1 Tax=Melia azedarach TaxID=155640 RepID=A0ACC1YRL6_MELAZ|nr:Cytochrome P450 [Melia azedarach]
MELGFLFSAILLALLPCAFTLLKLGKRSNNNNRASNLPPGPWKLPLIGNLHNLVGSLPHRGLRDLADEHGPLMHLQLGQIPTVVVSSPEFAKEVMKTHDVIFASRPQTLPTKIMSYDFTDIIFSPYGDYWRQLRKICVSELLSTKRVQSFRSVREGEVSNLINWISSKGGSVINLTDKVYALMYGITSRAAFRNKSRDQEAFVSVIEETTKVAAGFNIADLFPSIGLLQSITGVRSHVERLHQEADRILENIIGEHKKRNETLKNGKSEEDEDLVDVLLRIQEHGDLELPLSTDNIKAVIFDIFGAGSETSATTVDWAMSEMMRNPRVLEKAQAEVREIFNRKGKVDETSIDEMKFLKLVIKETLRLHPPAPLLIPRECGERCEINGFEIPVKARVIVNAWAIGRNPKYWTDPESFVPERFIDHSVDYKGTNFEYIPFGSGRRICPGMSFGLASVEVPLAMLLYHFDWRLPNGTDHKDLDMSEAFGVTVRRRQDLSIIPIPYHPLSLG